MANKRFEKCCHDFDLVRKTSQFDWINCFANHDLQFSVYFHKNNNSSCYCLNSRLLGQYWRCIINDRDYFCPSACEQCKICKDVSHIFSELQDAYFFNPNTHIHSFENLPDQPVAWRIFSATNKKPLSIQIAKPKLSLGTITDDGEVCRSKICSIVGSFLL